MVIDECACEFRICNIACYVMVAISCIKFSNSAFRARVFSSL